MTKQFPATYAMRVSSRMDMLSVTLQAMPNMCRKDSVVLTLTADVIRTKSQQASDREGSGLKQKEKVTAATAV